MSTPTPPPPPPFSGGNGSPPLPAFSGTQVLPAAGKSESVSEPPPAITGRNERLHFLSAPPKKISTDWSTSEKWKTGLETFDWDPIPARGQTDIYEIGAVLGPFLNVKDKSGGVEPGFLGYARDEKYQEAVSRIILKHLTAKPIDNESPIVKFFNSNNLQIDMQTILPAIENLENPGYPIEPETLKKIHEIFIEIENNCGATLVEELKAEPLDKYLIKQDYKDPKSKLSDNYVSISARRAKMTAGAKELGAEYGEWAQKARAKVHNLGRLETKRKANQNGFMESMSTRLAAASGMETQVQGVVKGTYEKPPKLKLVTMTKWQEGFSDFDGRLLGGNTRDGQFVVEMERDKNGKIIGPKRDIDGYFQSDAKLKGLGENLVAMLRQDDFDFFGTKGGNKGIVDNKFFGIDFGHAYERDNQIVGSLKDDFSFTQPKTPVKNASALYDNSLSDKMQGIILLCKLRGKFVPKNVVASYGPDFVKKYNALIPNSDYDIFEKYKTEAIKLEKNDPIGYRGLAEEVEKRYNRAIEADRKILEVFKDRINLTAQELTFIDNMEKLCSETTSLSPHGKNKGDKNVNIKKMQVLEEKLKKNKELQAELKFQTTKITPEILKIKLEDLEKERVKLQQNLDKEYKKNAVVKLNHLRVDPKSRVACQLTKVGKDYIISLNLPSDPAKIKIVQDRILKMDPNIVMNISTSNKLEIRCNAPKLHELMQIITEDKIKALKEPKALVSDTLGKSAEASGLVNKLIQRMTEEDKIKVLEAFKEPILDTTTVSAERNATINEMFGPKALSNSIKARGLSFIEGAKLILKYQYPQSGEMGKMAQQLQSLDPQNKRDLKLEALEKAWKKLGAQKEDLTEDDLKALITDLAKEIERNEPKITDTRHEKMTVGAQKRIKKIRKEELAHAENHANWGERKPLQKVIQLSSKDKDGNGKDIFQVRIDEPITRFTKEQEKEWLQIIAPEENWPHWFKKLPQWEKNLLINKVSEWDEKNSYIKRMNSNMPKGKDKQPLINLGDHLGVPPTTIRGYPGARNAYKSYFYNYELKNGKPELVNQAFKIRSGHITPDKMESNKERLKASKENIKQLILAHVEQQIKNGNENLLFDLQTLITPPLKPEDMKMDKARLDAVSAIRKEFKNNGFNEFLEKNGVSVPPGKKMTLTLLTPNYPVNKVRTLVNVVNIAMMLVFPLTAPLLYNSIKRIVENNRTTRALNAIVKETPLDKQDDNFKMAKAAFDKMNEISGLNRFRNFFNLSTFTKGAGLNHNAERAALEQIAVSGLGGVRLGSCMSGKDREGGVSEHLAAMTGFYAKYNQFPPIPPTSKVNIDENFKSNFPGKTQENLRAEYEGMVATEFLAGYEQHIANVNAPGANGLKDIQHILGHNVMKAAKKIIVEKYFKDASPTEKDYWKGCDIEKITKEIASLNRVKDFSEVVAMKAVDKPDNTPASSPSRKMTAQYDNAPKKTAMTAAVTPDPTVTPAPKPVKPTR